MSDSPLTLFVTKHILSTVRGMASYGTDLPGGIHKGVGPDGIPYPFAVYAFASGYDKPSLNTSLVSKASGGLLYQVKVVDLGDDEGRAAASYSAIVTALRAANSVVSFGAVITGQEESAIDLPVTERDQRFQQIGGIWRFWVDPI